MINEKDNFPEQRPPTWRALDHLIEKKQRLLHELQLDERKIHEPETYARILLEAYGQALLEESSVARAVEVLDTAQVLSDAKIQKSLMEALEKLEKGSETDRLVLIEACERLARSARSSSTSAGASNQRFV
jgi:hypothetical protein